MSSDKKHISFSSHEPLLYVIFVIAVFAFAIIFLIFKTAVKNEKTADGRVIIDYWEKWTGFEKEAIERIVDDFNKSQDRIFVRLLTVSTIDQKFMLSVAGGNPPDIAGLWSSNVNVFAEKGALMPLNKILEAKGIRKENYIPVFWELCEHKGFVWALPSTPATLALHWNKRLFREAGLDPEKPPQNRKELDMMNERLTVVSVLRDGRKVNLRYYELTEQEKAEKNFEIIQLGYTPTEPGWWNPMWPYWFDGDLWDGVSKITAIKAENIEALKWFKSFGEKYGVQNLRNFGASFGNFSSPQNPFLSEKVAMVLQGVWMYNFIEKYAPHIEWGAAPFPRLNDEGKGEPVSIAECDVVVIPKGARHPNEAIEFIAFLQRKESMEKLAMEQRKFSPLAYCNPDFIHRHPNKYINVFIELAKSPSVKIAPKIPVWNEYNVELSVAFDQVFTGIMSAESALQNAQQRSQWKFDKFLRRWNVIAKERLKEWSELNDSW